MAKKKKASLPTLSKVQATIYRDSLARFVRAAWSVIERKPLVWNWHLDLICDLLEKVHTGEFRKPYLIINVPPGTMKSTLVSVMFPAWVWLSKPETRSVHGSYAEALAIRDRDKCRDIIKSDWYQGILKELGTKWRLGPAVDSKSDYKNTETGRQTAVGKGGKGTGWRGDYVVIDDPLSVQEANSEAENATANNWVTVTMPTRLNDIDKDVTIIIMQRLRVDDATGTLIDKCPDDCEVVCLPMEYDPTRPYKDDPRTDPGQLLFPAKFPERALKRKKITLGSEAYQTQYNQNPFKTGGEILEHGWRRRFDCIPDNFDEIYQSWDLRFGKSKRKGSYVCGLVIGRIANKFYVLDLERGRWSFVESKQAMVRLSKRWPLATKKLVENKANGPALEDDMNSQIGGIILYEPSGDKEARAHNIAPIVEAGDVYFPPDDFAPWVPDFIQEVFQFPNWATDDQMDVLAQGLGFRKGIWLSSYTETEDEEYLGAPKSPFYKP